MTQLRHDIRPKRTARQTTSHECWIAAIAIGWSLLLAIILPFPVITLPIRVAVTTVSLASLYVLSRSLRGWHYWWATPLVVFWLVVNCTMWTCPYWTEEDYKRAVEEWSERIKLRRIQLPVEGGQWEGDDKVTSETGRRWAVKPRRNGQTWRRRDEGTRYRCEKWLKGGRNRY